MVHTVGVVDRVDEVDGVDRTGSDDIVRGRNIQNVELVLYIENLPMMKKVEVCEVKTVDRVCAGDRDGAVDRVDEVGGVYGYTQCISDYLVIG